MTKTILITGTSSGFGYQSALHFAEQGWKVIATMRNLDKADDKLKNHSNITLKKLDVTDREQVEQAVAETLEEFGRIDVLFNNAGYSEIGVVEETSAEHMHRQFETNFFGLINCIQAVLPSMRKNQAGHIMNTSSMGAYANIPTMGVYCASKAAVNSITETLSKEVKPFNIKLTNIEPGGYQTEFFDNLQFTSSRIEGYDVIYKEAEEWSHAEVAKGLGNMKKTVALFEKIAGSENPPLHLSVGKEGYDLAILNLENLLKQYQDNFELTKQTD
ncbi:SDR family oxidoreductase [Metabacillus idriensis]|uniref:SDR family oxidoreductase n=2 Tax=Bacillaceae TaxID=186817 RepID=UPI001747FB0B|nr:SDR family oxidoreductase [Metabacillus idriensis]